MEKYLPGKILSDAKKRIVDVQSLKESTRYQVCFTLANYLYEILLTEKQILQDWIIALSTYLAEAMLRKSIFISTRECMKHVHFHTVLIKMHERRTRREILKYPIHSSGSTHPDWINQRKKFSYSIIFHIKFLKIVQHVYSVHTNLLEVY